MSIGILVILVSGVFFLIKNSIAGWILLKIGIAIVVISLICTYFKHKIIQVQINEASVDRSLSVLDKIGGSGNININLSMYGDLFQLLALKDNRLYIGYNNFKTEKAIPYESIIKLDVKVATEEVGTAYQYSENTVKDIINCISVIVYTDTYTEEINFKYVSYNNDQAQSGFNNILKELERLKLILKDFNPSIDLGNNSLGNTLNESIPELIRKYKELLDIDAITLEEYETKKKELLNRKD
ncbi:MAG: SHOCT domain-containing protein [Clostridium sp.]